MKTKPITIRLDEGQLCRLKQAAREISAYEEIDMSYADLIRRMIGMYLTSRETYEKAKELSKRRK